MSRIRLSTVVGFAAGAVGVLVLSVGTAGADTVVIQEGLNGYAGTVDTYIKGGLPTSTHGSEAVVEWDGDDLGGQDFGLLRFDNIFGAGPNQIPSGAVVSSATLTYNIDDNPGDTGTANEVLVDWDESVTYDTFGGDAGVQTGEYGTQVGSATGGLGDNTLDVTSSIVTWAGSPLTNKGWIFRPTGGNGGVAFRSSENASALLRPKLSVTYMLVTKVEIEPAHIDAVVGEAHVDVTVFIPPGSNDAVAVEVTLTTDDAGVAVPVGATGDWRTITFNIGAPTQQNVSIDIGSVGSATITTTNGAGLGNDSLTVGVTAGAGTFIPASLSAIANSTASITVAISNGSNDTRAVEVTLTTDDVAVVVPVGATGDWLVLTFAEGAATEQMVDLDIGVSGNASITLTDDSGLDDAVLPVGVTTGFHFTVTADPRSEVTRWDHVLVAMNDNVGGPGAFHVSPGDIDPSDNPQLLRDKINLRHGTNAIWYPGVGNHERESPSDMTWIRDEYNIGHGGRPELKYSTNQDGPATSAETTYTWDYGDAHFIMLNQYWNGSSDIGTDGDIVPAMYDWLVADLAANTQPVVFVFGHEPAYPRNRHVGDSLDQYPAHRDAFWSLLEAEGVQAFFCGHTHVYSKYQPTTDSTWQVDVGNAGNDSSGAPDEQTFADITVTGSSVRFDIWQSTTMGGTTFQMIDTWEVPIGLAISLAPTEFDRAVDEGSDLPNDSFTVTAVGEGTLNYTITDDAGWLSVSPDSGASTGGADPIDIIYELADLLAGQYQGLISVSSGDAGNSPQVLTVNLTVETVSPDFDGDGDVDQEDFGHFQACLRGAGVPQNDPDCLDAQLDADTDVDQADFSVFQGCISGADVPAERTCDD